MSLLLLFKNRLFDVVKKKGSYPLTEKEINYIRNLLKKEDKPLEKRVIKRKALKRVIKSTSKEIVQKSGKGLVDNKISLENSLKNIKNLEEQKDLLKQLLILLESKKLQELQNQIYLDILEQQRQEDEDMDFLLLAHLSQ